MKFINDRRRMQGQSGFTLIELLVVIAILGILASVTVFAVSNLTDEAQDVACVTDQQTIETAVEAYKADTGNYPADLDTLVTDPNSKWLREPPTTGRWDYNATTGVVSATDGGDCDL